jgi:hypothetical protein
VHRILCATDLSPACEPPILRHIAGTEASESPELDIVIAYP